MFIGIYIRFQVSVYRTIGRLVFCLEGSDLDIDVIFITVLISLLSGEETG